MQQQNHQKHEQKDMSSQLSDIQLNLKIAERQYMNLHDGLAKRSKLVHDNHQKIMSVFVKVISTSFKPIELILRFMQDSDVLNLATTCQTIYRFVYSPLGFRIIRSLRPVVVKIKRQADMPVYNKNYLENLCNEVNLANMDEDDKIAVIQTMKTNLMAARQKTREIQQCNEQWQIRKTKIQLLMTQTIQKKVAQHRQIEVITEQKQKLSELLTQASSNIQKLRQSQQKMLNQRQVKKTQLELERQKLKRQKELLIKKIKAQQKQRQEAMIYAREVQRISTMLNKLTSKSQHKK